jgi:hypothetical protein
VLSSRLVKLRLLTRVESKHEGFNPRTCNIIYFWGFVYLYFLVNIAEQLISSPLAH